MVLIDPQLSVFSIDLEVFRYSEKFRTSSLCFFGTEAAATHYVLCSRANRQFTRALITSRGMCSIAVTQSRQYLNIPRNGRKYIPSSTGLSNVRWSTQVHDCNVVGTPPPSPSPGTPPPGLEGWTPPPSPRLLLDIVRLLFGYCGCLFGLLQSP